MDRKTIAMIKARIINGATVFLSALAVRLLDCFALSPRQLCGLNDHDNLAAAWGIAEALKSSTFIHHLGIADPYNGPQAFGPHIAARHSYKDGTGPSFVYAIDRAPRRHQAVARPDAGQLVRSRVAQLHCQRALLRTYLLHGSPGIQSQSRCLSRFARNRLPRRP